jgi:hypothetical protein
MARPRSKAGSFIEKVGEYIKPSRPESVYSQKTGYASIFGDDKSSMKGCVTDGQERWDKRWSRVSGTVRKSFSRDRGVDVDGRIEDSVKRRSRVMPVSLALKRYNEAVAGY